MDEVIKRLYLSGVFPEALIVGALSAQFPQYQVVLLGSEKFNRCEPKSLEIRRSKIPWAKPDPWDVSQEPVQPIFIGQENNALTAVLENVSQIPKAGETRSRRGRLHDRGRISRRPGKVKAAPF